ncbi:MAG: helicase C-terminal domain-containing protein, partial [Candidatus Nitrosopolaris sp.]
MSSFQFFGSNLPAAVADEAALGDRWIDEKRKINEQWYSWQTALRLIQGYGRSIRSKEDWA